MMNKIASLVKSHPMFKQATHPAIPVILYSYNFADPTVFSNPVAREIRGIIFDDRGNIVARPYHKFFNYGEPLCTVDSKETADSTMKIDGSLVTAFIYNNQLYFASKGSFKSWVVKKAYKIADDRIHDLVREFRGKTVIFELVDPEHPIVLQYIKPQLILTGIRDNETGAYTAPSEVQEIADSYSIPHTNIVHRESEIYSIVKEVQGWQGKEGVVAYASDLCKIKSQWYLRMHSVVSWIVAENRDVVEKRVRHLLINNELDDIYPMMLETHKRIVDDIVGRATQEIRDFERTVKQVLAEVQGMARKDVALYMQARDVPKPVRAVIFRVIQNPHDDAVRTAVYEYFRKVWR